MHVNKRSGWLPYDESLDQQRSARVVRLGAICDFETGSPEAGPSQSFSVREFVALDDGRNVVVSERGFTISTPREVVELEDGRRVILENTAPMNSGLTLDIIRQDVLNVVLPDDDDGEPHPWQWLAEQAQLYGINVTAVELKALSYEVSLTKRLANWISDSCSPC